MTTETATMTAATDAPAALESRGYGSLWKRVPRELGFLLLTMPLAIIGLSVILPVFLTGLGTLVLVFGIFIFVASFYIARGFGTLELVRLRWAGRPGIRAPQWQPENRPAGFWRATVGPVADGHYWLYLLHGVVISPIVSTFSWAVTIAWTSIGLGGVTYWVWGRFLPDGDREIWLHDIVLDFIVPGNPWLIDPRTGEAVFTFIAGGIFVLTLPFITRALTLVHWGVARGLLASWRSEALEREVAALDASRGSAVHAEDASLRRLERDIHDGPQQRLIRLQMDLAAAERRLATDPDSAAALLVDARGQAKDTLDELRALSRGFAPPILQDRGLASALRSLAARSILPITVELGIAEHERFAPEIERSVYFIAAELLANATKHAEANAVGLFVSRSPVTATEAGWIDVWVTDDGHGGAAPVPGHGLGGLLERINGLRGRLVIDSPTGGPTRIGAHVPLF
jgi:signal transduction histidine kinase